MNQHLHASNASFKDQGFTLIELMITVAILAILGTIAISSYRSYMVRANRTEATAALLRVQVAQEKFFMQNSRYATTAELALAPPLGLGLFGTTERGFYNLAVTPAAPTTAYTVTATVVSGSGQADDTSCNQFTINETGTRMAYDDGGTLNNSICWR